MNANVSILKKAALTAVAALLLAPVARAGVGIDIHIDAPPPVIVETPAVVIAPAPIVVVQDPWVVGYRQNLYDADLRLRIAQSDQYQARVDLDAARAREADLVLDVQDQQGAVDDLRHRAEAADAATGQIRAQLDRAAQDVEAARAHVADAEHHAAAAKANLDAIGGAGQPAFDAASQYHHAQAAVAAAQADLDDATGHLAQLQARDPRVEVEAARAAVRTAEAKLGQMQTDLDRAHDDVYACQQRLEDQNQAICVALHDRDESLWLLHRDEIIAGTVDCSTFGFSFEVGWRSHWHGNIDELHSYCVHPVAYWVASPVLIVDRIDFVNVHVTDVIRVREVEHVHAVEKLRVVEHFETTVKVEDRRKVYETVKVERGRLTAEKTERTVAAKEGRRPTVSYSKPADVQIAQLRHTDAKLDSRNHALSSDNAALEAKNRKDAGEIAALKKDNTAEKDKLNATDGRLEKADNRLNKDNAKIADESKPDTSPAPNKHAHGTPTDTGTASSDPSRHSRTPAAPAPDTGTASSDTNRHSRTPAAPAPDTGTASSDTNRHSRTPAAPAPDPGTASSDTNRHSRTPAPDAGTPADPNAPKARRPRGGDDSAATTPPADPRSATSDPRGHRAPRGTDPNSAETDSR